MKSSKIKKTSLGLGVAASLLVASAFAKKEALSAPLWACESEACKKKESVLHAEFLLRSTASHPIDDFLPEQQNRVYSCVDKDGNYHIYWQSVRRIRHFSPQEFAVSGSTVCGLQNGGLKSCSWTQDFAKSLWCI